jgi:transcriptional regulator with XRE-family HTH domain
MTESELRSILGTNIKKYRCFRGFSQAKLAELIDLSPNFISELETGKRWISSDTLANLAGALGIGVYDFFKPEETFPDDMTAFISKYTAEATALVTNTVSQSLEGLRAQYVDRE